MKNSRCILIGASCVFILIAAWVITISTESAAEKQHSLILQATELINDGIYIRAVPLLEQAAELSAVHLKAAEEHLKVVYLALIDSRGFSRKYTSLLKRQLSRKDVSSEIFAEAANYYLSVSRTGEALEILKSGIEKTGCVHLCGMYENHRYAFGTIRTTFEYISEIKDGFVQVSRDGRWGIARANGTMLIPCEYEKISTFESGRAIVMKGSEIFAVDRDNNRIALLHEAGADMGNLMQNRIPLLIDGSWRRATGDFVLGDMQFEELGNYSEGYAAAKTGGRWGVIDIGSHWIVPPEYDEIKTDALGRSYGQGAVFALNGYGVYLIVDGQQVGEPFEDARPFSSEGYAAVKKNGKWGFIDINANVMIDFQFDDALSFGQHLAAVKIDEHWGYVSKAGRVEINPQFLEARSFSGGNAPVLSHRGWQIISLLEYEYK